VGSPSFLDFYSPCSLLVPEGGFLSGGLSEYIFFPPPGFSESGGPSLPPIFFRLGDNLAAVAGALFLWPWVLKEGGSSLGEAFNPGAAFYKGHPRGRGFT